MRMREWLLVGALSSAALVLAVPLSACGKDAPAAGAAQAADAGDGTGKATGHDAAPGEIEALADGAYFGVLKARVLPPEGSGLRATSRNGTASGELQESGRLVVSGDIERDGDAGVAADGDFASGGWSGESGGVELHIGSDGTIHGGGTSGDQRMSIEGTMTRRRLDLFFEVELMAATGGGFPAGTRFQFRYELWRPFSRPEGQDRGETPAGGCREVVYRNKLVPNLSGGAMGMVRVPECRR